MNKAVKRRIVELGKDVLIVLLACSTVWLATRAELFGAMGGLLGEEEAPTGGTPIQTETRAEAARPLRMAVNLLRGTETARFGVQYSQADCDLLFQQVASLLVEALSSAGEAEEISSRQWNNALLSAPGVYFDFQGAVPLPVLIGWLSGEDTQLQGNVRRLALTASEDSVAICYRNETDGNFYRCFSDVVDPAHLEEALSGLAGNGAFYAFESEYYDMLDPYTLLSAEVPAPSGYTAENPASGGRSDLEAIAGELEFLINANGVYYAGEWVARSGSDTLRLSDEGEVVYLAGEDENDHFVVPNDGGLFTSVELCRELAVKATAGRCGQARIYLESVTQAENGWDISFAYSLNGIPVRLSGGSAAVFRVRGNRVDEFAIQLRRYSDLGEATVVLPTRQAAAALEAMGLTGEELALMYVDNGGEVMTAGWTASDWTARARKR